MGSKITEINKETFWQLWSVSLKIAADRIWTHLFPG